MRLSTLLHHLPHQVSGPYCAAVLVGMHELLQKRRADFSGYFTTADLLTHLPGLSDSALRTSLKLLGRQDLVLRRPNPDSPRGRKLYALSARAHALLKTALPRSDAR